MPLISICHDIGIQKIIMLKLIKLQKCQMKVQNVEKKNNNRDKKEQTEFRID